MAPVRVCEYGIVLCVNRRSWGRSKIKNISKKEKYFCVLGGVLCHLNYEFITCVL